MDVFIEPIGRLMNEFSKLPGVGAKTAQRYAYRIIDMSESEARAFADAVIAAKRKVRFCKICGNFTEEEVCAVCKTRDSSTICVVKEPKDVIALEKIREYKGVYHVLHGVLDPMNGKSVNDIRINELLARVRAGGVKEVIMATDTDVTGEATAMYVAGLLKPLGITVTRIARGVPIGSELEYADEVTLSRALTERKEM